MIRACYMRLLKNQDKEIYLKRIPEKNSSVYTECSYLVKTKEICTLKKRDHKVVQGWVREWIWNKIWGGVGVNGV